MDALASDEIKPSVDKGRIDRRLDAQSYGNLEWRKVAKTLLTSRAIDHIEETELVPEKKISYQFSARGHDFAQVVLAQHLDDKMDSVCGYYRSRPLLLGLGVDLVHAIGSSMARSGGYSDGRDIGVVFNHPNPDGPKALPMAGGVGTQYTPTIGWAQSILYKEKELKDPAASRAIAVCLGGDASVATNGFWAALTIATTQKLPVLFYIEDNQYGISVPSTFQTPKGNIASNLKSFAGLKVIDGDGCNPKTAPALIEQAVTFVRDRKGPCLLRLKVPRLQGHSFQDLQTYKTDKFVSEEWARDPLPKLKSYVVPDVISEKDWTNLETETEQTVRAAIQSAQDIPFANPASVTSDVFFECGRMQKQGGQWAEGYVSPDSSEVPQPQSRERVNMVTSIRRTLDHELATNPRVLMFGEDIGPKGGVHSATLGLQKKHGENRVFDTSLNEEGIVGRAVGMALAGLMPIPEIQFRKYADPATEQINDCGTIRWRTNNQFAAPMVLRMPGGFFKCGDPWHSQTNEVQFAHAIGWKLAFPSNAEDAVGLLRSAMRGNDPVIFFEHRAQLDDPWARRPYPGDDFVLPFGKGKLLSTGNSATIVTWGAMVQRCEKAAIGRDCDVIDLRTLVPWDVDMVLSSVARTGRCLIVHEDNTTAGFGAEIAAKVADEAFWELDAPVKRLAMPDIPSPHSPALMKSVVPSVETISKSLDALLEQ